MNSRFVLYDEYAASLAICGGISGLTGNAKCEGTPAETEGRSGGAVFKLRALENDKGAGIDISKEAWTWCVAAARAACPEGSFEAVCRGGATRGDVGFSLTVV
jgi:hypothetical protein